MDKLTQFLSAHPVILGDGAMGTMLQAAGLTTGGSPEEWNVTRPEVLKGIYQAYTDAGAQVITTNTFGCNRFRLGLHNFEHRVAEFNLAAVKTAREVAAAADHEVLIVGDMGRRARSSSRSAQNAGRSPRCVRRAGGRAGRGRGGLLPDRDHEHAGGGRGCG